MCGEPAKAERQVQTDKVLAYPLTYPKSSPREIIEHCGFSKKIDLEIPKRISLSSTPVNI